MVLNWTLPGNRRPVTNVATPVLTFLPVQIRTWPLGNNKAASRVLSLQAGRVNLEPVVHRLRRELSNLFEQTHCAFVVCDYK